MSQANISTSFSSSNKRSSCPLRMFSSILLSLSFSTGVIVDGIVLSRDDSRFLQQASLLTGGVYHKPIDQHNCLQLMTTHVLPSAHSRIMLRAPLQKMVDFRASCFCHHKPVVSSIRF